MSSCPIPRSHIAGRRGVVGIDRFGGGSRGKGGLPSGRLSPRSATGRNQKFSGDIHHEKSLVKIWGPWLGRVKIDDVKFRIQLRPGLGLGFPREGHEGSIDDAKIGQLISGKVGVAAWC